MSVTLSQLISRVRQRADMVGSSFVTDAEVTVYVNDALTELYDVLVREYGTENFISTHYFYTVASQNDYNLPTDFYRLAGIDVNPGDGYVELSKFNHSDRNLYANEQPFNSTVPRMRYRLRDSTFELQPAPPDAYGSRVYYIPQITALAADGDTVDSSIVTGHIEYAVVTAAIKCLNKEESDISTLTAEQTMLRARIGDAAKSRDITLPDPVLDSDNTLHNIRIKCRHRAGAIGSDGFTDREITNYINDSLGELHDLMIAAYGNEYFQSTSQVTTVADQELYDLPTDFYKLNGVDLVSGSYRYSLRRYNQRERNQHRNSSSGHRSLYTDSTSYHYRLIGNKLSILPVPGAGETLTLHYTPELSTLSADGDKVNAVIPEGWLEYIYVDVAIKMLQKRVAGGDAAAVSILSDQRGAKAAMEARVKKMAEARDWGEPDTMSARDNLNFFLEDGDGSVLAGGGVSLTQINTILEDYVRKASGSENQVGVFDASSYLAGDSNFTWDGTTLSATDLSVSRGGHISVALTVGQTGQTTAFVVFDTTNYGGTTSTLCSDNISYSSTNGKFTVSGQGDFKIDANLFVSSTSTAALDVFNVKVNTGVVLDGSGVTLVSGSSPQPLTLKGIFTLAANDEVTINIDPGAGIVTIKPGSTISIQRVY